MPLNDVNDLYEAISWRRLFALNLALELRLPQIRYSTHHKLLSDIERQSKACGCAEGGGGAIVFLGMYLIALGLDVWRPGSTLSAAAAGWGALVLGTLVGKVFGLVRARLALRNTLLEVARELQTSSQSTSAAEPHATAEPERV